MMPPVYAITSSSGPDCHDDMPGAGESPFRLLRVGSLAGIDFVEGDVGDVGDVGLSNGASGFERAISPTVAKRPTMLAAINPADRTCTRCAIFRSAPAECGDQAQLEDSGGGMRLFSSPANSEFDLALAM